MSLFSRLKEKQKELQQQQQQQQQQQASIKSEPSLPSSPVLLRQEEAVAVSGTPSRGSNSRVEDQISSNRDDNADDGEKEGDGDWLSPKQKVAATPLKFFATKLKTVELDKLVWAPYFNYSNKLFPARLCSNQEALGETTIDWPLPDSCCVVEIFGQIEHSKNRKLLQVLRKDLLPYYANSHQQIQMNDFDANDMDHWNDTLCMKLKKAVVDKAKGKRGDDIYEHVMQIANQFLELALQEAQKKAISANLIQEDEEEDDFGEEDDGAEGKVSKLDSLMIGDATDLSLEVGDHICYYDKVLSSRLVVTSITNFTKDPSAPLELKNGDILYGHTTIGKLPPSFDETQSKHPNCSFYPVSRYFDCMEANQHNSKKSSKSTKVKPVSPQKNKKSIKVDSSTTASSSSSSSSQKDSSEADSQGAQSAGRSSRRGGVAADTPPPVPTKTAVKQASSPVKMSKVQAKELSKEEEDIDSMNFFEDSGNSSKKKKKTSSTSSKEGSKPVSSKVSSDENKSAEEVAAAKSEPKAKKMPRGKVVEDEEELPSTGSRKRSAKQQQEEEVVAGSPQKRARKATPEEEVTPTPSSVKEDGSNEATPPSTSSKFHSKRKRSDK